MYVPIRALPSSIKVPTTSCFDRCAADHARQKLTARLAASTGLISAFSATPRLQYCGRISATVFAHGANEIAIAQKSRSAMVKYSSRESRQRGRYGESYFLEKLYWEAICTNSWASVCSVVQKETTPHCSTRLLLLLLPPPPRLSMP